MYKKLLLLGAMFWCQSAIAAENPIIRVFSSVGSNQKAGQNFQIGQLIYTGKGGVVTGDLRWSGIKYFSILPNSSFKLTEYGGRQGGGRVSRVDITGEVIVSVIVTNPNSRVRVCFINFWRKEGCTYLRSSVRYQSSDGVVAVSEGNVKLEPGPFTVKGGEYSILGKDGKFSAPRSINGPGSVLRIGRSKTIGVWEALPGWRFFDGSTVWQGPIVGPMKSPISP